MNNLMRLGNVMDGRMKSTSGAAVSVCTELGTINSNMSLTTDSMRVPIPKGDYMIDIRLNGETTTKPAGEHTHSHTMPSGYRGLQPGDRVMVNWCGNEPVVVAIVVSS